MLRRSAAHRRKGKALKSVEVVADSRNEGVASQQHENTNLTVVVHDIDSVQEPVATAEDLADDAKDVHQLNEDN